MLSFTIDATEGYSERDAPFQYAWARARLWQQYAENHAGVCLVFDLMETTPRLYDALGRLGVAGYGKVAYTPRGFSDTPTSTLLLNEFELETLAADVARLRDRDRERDLFFAKALDWESEHEFRFTLMLNTEPGRRAGRVFVRELWRVASTGCPRRAVPDVADPSCSRHVRSTWHRGISA